MPVPVALALFRTKCNAATIYTRRTDSSVWLAVGAAGAAARRGAESVAMLSSGRQKGVGSM